jgi:hypothetical protein
MMDEVDGSTEDEADDFNEPITKILKGEDVLHIPAAFYVEAMLDINRH